MSQTIFEAAIEAAIELMDDLLSPEMYGHAIPEDVHTRVFVVRSILRREYTRRTQDARTKAGL
jgi:hypothetical protein